MQEWEVLTQKVINSSPPTLEVTSLAIEPAKNSTWQGPTVQALDNLLKNSAFSGLQRLELIRCQKLTTMPGAMAKLEQLSHLIICSCTKLEKLPPNMYNLLNLQQSAVTACTNLRELPHNLTSRSHAQLTEVDLNGCHQLQVLPSCIGRLPALETLNLTDCRSLTVLPGTLQDCASLKSVMFAGCQELQGIVGRPLLTSTAQAQDMTPVVIKQIIRKLDQHRSIIKLAKQQERMLETLERMSWIAVLLATATFIGFLQPPSGALTEGKQANTKLSDTSGVVDAAIKAFFILDTCSFLLSFASLVIIVVLSMPRLASQSYKREAGRFWLLLVLAWGQLYLAVGAGCGAFVASAFAMYVPTTPSIWVPTCWGGFLLFLGLCIICQRFRNLYPGLESIALGIAEIWQRDLPFHGLIPCGGLLRCIACEYVLEWQERSAAKRRVLISQQSAINTAVAATAQDTIMELNCFNSCIMAWITCLIDHNLISPKQRSSPALPLASVV